MLYSQEIDTRGADVPPDGRLMKRRHAGRTIVQYVLVPSSTKFRAQLRKLSGAVRRLKTAAPGMGCFAIRQHPESNAWANSDKNQ